MGFAVPDVVLRLGAWLLIAAGAALTLWSVHRYIDQGGYKRAQGEHAKIELQREQAANKALLQQQQTEAEMLRNARKAADHAHAEKERLQQIAADAAVAGRRFDAAAGILRNTIAVTAAGAAAGSAAGAACTAPNAAAALGHIAGACVEVLGRARAEHFELAADAERLAAQVRGLQAFDQVLRSTQEQTQ